MDLKKLTKADLTKLSKFVNHEVTRRQAIEKAEAEILEVLANYNLKPSDINVTKTTNRKVKATTKKRKQLPKRKNTTKKISNNENSVDRRSIVKQQYKDNASEQTWSGRGRTPKWVESLCEREKITLVDFRRDSRFKL